MTDMSDGPTLSVWKKLLWVQWRKRGKELGIEKRKRHMTFVQSFTKFCKNKLTEISGDFNLR